MESFAISDDWIKEEKKKKKKEKRKKMPLILLIIIGVLLVLFIALVLWLPSFMMTGTRQTLEEAFAWQSEHYDTGFYDTLEKTDYSVNGADGYVLHAELLKNPVLSTKYIIISHGYTDNRMGALKYVPLYIDLGFNCIIYDLRGHGENEPTFTTYGVREGEDLNCLIEDTRNRYPDLTELGLHGESLGAATTITALKDKPQVDFAVADCGFSDIENVLREGGRNSHAPGFLVDLADIGSRIRYKYAIKDMRPIDSLDHNEVPILFLHGENDTVILPKNSEDMAARTSGEAEYHTIPGAGHAESVMINPELYKQYVEGFLEEIEKK